MWKVEVGRAAEKQLAKLDGTARDRILRLLKRVSQSDDARALAEPLVGGFAGFWRYRVGDYRVIVRIDDGRVTVYVIEVGHRREVYR